MLVYDLSFLLCDQEGRRGKIQKGLKLFCKSSASFEDSAQSSQEAGKALSFNKGGWTTCISLRFRIIQKYKVYKYI